MDPTGGAPSGNPPEAPPSGKPNHPLASGRDWWRARAQCSSPNSRRPRGLSRRRPARRGLTSRAMVAVHQYETRCRPPAYAEGGGRQSTCSNFFCDAVNSPIPLSPTVASSSCTSLAARGSSSMSKVNSSKAATCSPSVAQSSASPDIRPASEPERCKAAVAALTSSKESNSDHLDGKCLPPAPLPTVALIRDALLSDGAERDVERNVWPSTVWEGARERDLGR
eukprot:scaffold122646_cov30-Tisochrysis_lutea.AAC.5